LQSEDLLEEIVSTENLSLVAKIRRWRYLKTFGSMEQLRSLVLFKFKKSEQVFLTGVDHNRIQVYWIPCPQQSNTSLNLTTAIFCGQNA